VTTRLAAGRLQTAAEVPARAAGPERFIPVKEAAVRLGQSPKWIYETRPGCPFVRRVGTRSLKVSVLALDRYFPPDRACEAH
jgi:hypothetical protein